MDNRNRSDRSERKSSGNAGHIEQEVQNLFYKNKAPTRDTFAKLLQKYGDTAVVDKIFEAYNEKHHHIVKKAKKFAQLIREKYTNSNYPYHILLEKARLYKVKHGLTNEEFAEFQRIYEQDLIGIRSPEIMIPRNNMTKALGNLNYEYQEGDNKFNDTDFKYLQEILKLHAASKPLHSQVIIQSMQYQAFDNEAINGTYESKLGHKRTDAIHPVIVAMFIPKIEQLEKHFLFSNIAGIVKSRYNNERLTNQADYELFYALTNDHNDVVCDSQSSMQDLLNRALVQNQLWNSVINLRNGQYFTGGFRDFVSAIDICRSNKYDTPDLIYGRYDGTILKRLLATFSFRPTLVVTSAQKMQNVIVNPYQQFIRPVVTTVPMINIRLEISDEPYDLKEKGLKQSQLFLENGFVSTRETSVIYSKDVLFFFIDRRVNIIRYTDMLPYSLDRLPTSVAGFEHIHVSPVHVRPVLSIDKTQDTYELVSGVIAEFTTVKDTNHVTGSSAILRYEQIGHAETLYLYSPNDSKRARDYRTINDIPTDHGMRALSENCIVLMYKLKNDNTKGNLPYAGN
jgi:hypothetical protein